MDSHHFRNDDDDDKTCLSATSWRGTISRDALFYSYSALAAGTCWIAAHHGYWMIFGYVFAGLCGYVYLTACIVVPRDYVVFVTDFHGTTVELGTGTHWVFPVFSTLFRMWSDTEKRYKHLFHVARNNIVCRADWNADRFRPDISVSIAVQYSISDADKFVSSLPSEYDIVKNIVRKSSFEYISKCASDHTGLVAITVPANDAPSSAIYNRHQRARICMHSDCADAKHELVHRIEHNKRATEYENGVTINTIDIECETATNGHPVRQGPRRARKLPLSKCIE